MLLVEPMNRCRVYSSGDDSQRNVDLFIHRFRVSAVHPNWGTEFRYRHDQRLGGYSQDFAEQA